MPTPHKHAELIKAWADGAQIQVLTEDYGQSGETGNSWKDFGKDVAPGWVPSYQYRIKPEPQIIDGWIGRACQSGHRNFHINSPHDIQYFNRCTITIHPDE